MMPIRIALVGLGKISVDQHIPVIAGDDAFTLVAGASPDDRIAGLPHYASLTALLRTEKVDAVAINTPARVRFELAREALLADKHVLLEKPPCATVSELDVLRRIATDRGLTLYTAWHSQHAPAIAPARAWLAGKAVTAVSVVWREDAEKWHPGQRWIWEPGGFGVFDPGINALSILSVLLDDDILIKAASFLVREGDQAPVAAVLGGTVGIDGRFHADFDFRESAREIWSISIGTSSGAVELRRGGAELEIDGRAMRLDTSHEYQSVYRRFAGLIGSGASEVDTRPLLWSAEAFLIAERRVAG